MFNVERSKDTAQKEDLLDIDQGRRSRTYCRLNRRSAFQRERIRT